jgi:hypothetical protein
VASWGFVVAVPEHIERSRLSQELMEAGVTHPDQDVVDLLHTLELLATASSSVLQSCVDTGRVATTGYSTGGRAAVEAAVDDRITCFVVQSPAVFSPADADGRDPTPVPSKPGLIFAADQDLVIPFSRVAHYFDRLGSKNTMIVLRDAGHFSLTDMCPEIRKLGGLAQFAASLPIDPALLSAIENGCGPDNTPSEVLWPPVDAHTVAFLTKFLGSPVGLAPAGPYHDAVREIYTK